MPVTGKGFFDGGFEYISVDGKDYTVAEVRAALKRPEDTKVTFLARVTYLSGASGSWGSKGYSTLSARATVKMRQDHRVSAIDLYRVETKEILIERKERGS